LGERRRGGRRERNGVLLIERKGVSSPYALLPGKKRKKGETGLLFSGP